MLSYNYVIHLVDGSRFSGFILRFMFAKYFLHYTNTSSSLKFESNQKLHLNIVI